MLDDISLKILTILQEKARIPNVEVARQVGLAPSAVLERIRKLERTGIIDGYEVRLNSQLFSRSLVAYIRLLFNTGVDVPELADVLAGFDEIQEIQAVSGIDGLLLKIRVADTGELHEFIRNRIHPLKQISSIETSIVLKTYKETSRIPLNHIQLNNH